MTFYRKRLPIIILLLSFSTQVFASSITLGKKDLKNAEINQLTIVEAQ